MNSRIAINKSLSSGRREIVRFRQKVEERIVELAQGSKEPLMAHAHRSRLTGCDSFLYASLQMDRSCSRRTIQEIRTALCESGGILRDIIHISIWNVSFSILIGQNSVAEWLSG
jgi:hypothetical protein